MVHARWAVVIGGGKSPTKWAKKPLTIRKSTAKLSHIATGPRLARTGALAIGERPSGFTGLPDPKNFSEGHFG